jgi:hypothetical protein
VTSRRHIAALALPLLLLAIAVFAAPANAATTRAEYVAQVDPICQAGESQEELASQPLFRAFKRARKHGGLKSEKGQKHVDRALVMYFHQVVVIEHSVNNQIAAISPVPDDVGLIQVWLRARNELVDTEARFQHLAARDKYKKAARLFYPLLGLSYETADIVRDFGFQHCSQDQVAFVIAIGGSSTIFLS